MGGNRTLRLTPTIYIERSDFRETDSKDFYGMAPNKVVRLQYAYNLVCDEIIKDPATGKVVELKCTMDLDSLEPEKPPKGVLHWASEDFIKATVNAYDLLFAV